jgi:hypothetical protein
MDDRHGYTVPSHKWRQVGEVNVLQRIGHP